MSQEEVDRGEVVVASAGMLFYRRNSGEIEVLTAIRQNEPWKGYTTIDFGGLVKPLDGSGHPANMGAAHAALREGKEEGGKKFQLGAVRFLGHYGPQNFWHELERRSQEIVAIPTQIPTSNKDHFVHIIYAAAVLSGEPVETAEMKKPRWENPLDLADEGRPLAFEGALVLTDFWHKIRHHPSWTDPELASWIFTPRN